MVNILIKNRACVEIFFENSKKKVWFNALRLSQILKNTQTNANTMPSDRDDYAV